MVHVFASQLCKELLRENSEHAVAYNPNITWLLNAIFENVHRFAKVLRRTLYKQFNLLTAYLTTTDHDKKLTRSSQWPGVCSIGV